MSQVSSIPSHQRPASCFSSRENRLRVLLFSDYSIIRAGLKHILGQVADYFVIGETEGIQNFIQEIEKNPWDVVIADFSLEGDLKLDLSN